VFTVDGQEIASKKIPHTIPLLMTVDETFDVGSDTRTPVNDDYKLPFRFTGTIKKRVPLLCVEETTKPQAVGTCRLVCRCGLVGERLWADRTALALSFANVLKHQSAR
jgi:hypothetical protein